MAQTDRDSATTTPPSPPPQLQEAVDAAVAAQVAAEQAESNAELAETNAEIAQAAAEGALATLLSAVTASADALILADQRQTYKAFTSSGTSPTFTITTPPAHLYGSYTANERMRVVFNGNVTTGGSTLNRDGLGAKSIVQYDQTGTKVNALIYAGMPFILEYDGTDYVILNSIQSVLSGTLDLQSGQIKFPSTQNPSANANTLDDYEEGTWTASLRNSTSSIGGYSASYLKIGRLVFVAFDTILPSQTDSDAVVIDGLPFPISPGGGNAASLVSTETTAVRAVLSNAGGSSIAILTSASGVVTYTTMSGDTLTISASYITTN